MIVRWSPEAEKDASAVITTIAGESLKAAEHAIERLDMLVGRLESRPHLGKMVRENPVFREFFVQGYRFIYQVENSHIEFVAVLPSKRRSGPSAKLFESSIWDQPCEYPED